MTETLTYVSTPFLCICGHKVGAHNNPTGICGFADCLCIQYRPAGYNLVLGPRPTHPDRSFMRLLALYFLAGLVIGYLCDKL